MEERKGFLNRDNVKRQDSVFPVYEGFWFPGAFSSLLNLLPPS